MSDVKQDIKGSNNIQVVTNTGQIIQTKKVKVVTEVVHDINNHITDAQALQLREKISEIVDMLSSTGTNKAVLFPKEYGAFYKKFSITSYKLLPKDKFNEALQWLNKRSVYHGKKTLRKGNPEEWRKKQYKAINTRARQIGMNRDSILLFAEEKLSLKKPLSSIKDLSDTRLQKLYNAIIKLKV